MHEIDIRFFNSAMEMPRPKGIFEASGAQVSRSTSILKFSTHHRVDRLGEQVNADYNPSSNPRYPNR